MFGTRYELNIKGIMCFLLILLIVLSLEGEMISCFILCKRNSKNKKNPYFKTINKFQTFIFETHM